MTNIVTCAEVISEDQCQKVGSQLSRAVEIGNRDIILAVVGYMM